MTSPVLTPARTRRECVTGRSRAEALVPDGGTDGKNGWPGTLTEGCRATGVFRPCVPYFGMRTVSTMWTVALAVDTLPQTTLAVSLTV